MRANLQLHQENRRTSQNDHLKKIVRVSNQVTTFPWVRTDRRVKVETFTVAYAAL